MKDDKWICHIGKEITLSSSDRLAWFARAGVPRSLDGGEKRVGFQVRPTSQLLRHLPGVGSGASLSDLQSPATSASEHHPQGRAWGFTRRSSIMLSAQGPLSEFKPAAASFHGLGNHCSLCSASRWATSLWHDMVLSPTFFFFLLQEWSVVCLVRMFFLLQALSWSALLQVPDSACSMVPCEGS